MIRRCDPQLEFIYRLFSGMHIHTSGDSLSSDMRWQREYKRQIDITQLSQQVENYDIEVDWHALGRIALDSNVPAIPQFFSAIAPSTSVSRRCWPHMD